MERKNLKFGNGYLDNLFKMTTIIKLGTFCDATAGIGASIRTHGQTDRRTDGGRTDGGRTEEGQTDVEVKIVIFVMI